jgi:addiction module RelE/StbE family toxin
LAQLSYSERALRDIERLSDFLIESDPKAAVKTARIIVEAVRILANHPLIGRQAEPGLRELIISRGRTGYVALYSYEELTDRVLILAVRHQREAGYFGST